MFPSGGCLIGADKQAKEEEHKHQEGVSRVRRWWLPRGFGHRGRRRKLSCTSRGSRPQVTALREGQVLPRAGDGVTIAERPSAETGEPVGVLGWEFNPDIFRTVEDRVRLTRTQKQSQQWTLATTATGRKVELLLDGVSGGLTVPSRRTGR